MERPGLAPGSMANFKKGMLNVKNLQVNYTMDIPLAIPFLGGLTFTLALAAGMVRPWRGLLLLWAVGVIFGATGLVPGLSAPYVALATVGGAVTLMAAEEIARRWYRGHKEAVLAGKQLLTGSLAALLLAGIFLGPLWGMILAGGTGGLGAAYLARRHLLHELAAGLFLLCLRLGALFLTAVLLGGRLLGLF
ncbi:Uncharacterized [Moorella glycerini]|uniref:Uncharacterized protein n=2 Tax=Neomoorella stamsii TaxID=1266720 RepID=A0A9X7J4R2_9FIRM|nr:hypothetical protein MOST_08440 [Moorella stamsii]CEP67255.1 Uncharacterized [Moorella glycerini]